MSIYSDLHTTFYVLYGSLYRLLIQPSILYIYGMCKARIRTILGFCCPNVGSELYAIILGSHTQTSDPSICCANLGSARNHLGSRNQTSAIRGNKPTIDHARKAAWPSAATWVRCSGWPSCFACAIDRGFFAADGRTALCVRSIVASLTRMAELLCVLDRSWVCCHGWPRFGCVLPRMDEVWLCNPRRLRACGSEVCAAKSCFACTIDRGFVAADGRGLAARSQKIACGSEVYMRDPRIIVQKLGPRFGSKILGWSECVLCA